MDRLNKTSTNYSNCTIQLNTPLVITKPTKLKLKTFYAYNTVFNIPNNPQAYWIVQESVASTNGFPDMKEYNLTITPGSYTASDFATELQNTLNADSASVGQGFNYTVTYSSLTNNFTIEATSSSSGYGFEFYSLDSWLNHITGLFQENGGVQKLVGTTAHFNTLTLLIEVNNNHHNNITTSADSFSFVIPFHVSDTVINYGENSNFENSVIIHPQSFNYLTIVIKSLESNQVFINGDWIMFLELDIYIKQKIQAYKMDKKQLSKAIEDLFSFKPDEESIVEVVNDMVDFIEQILGKDIKQERVIIELKDKINEILDQ